MSEHYMNHLRVVQESCTNWHPPKAISEAVTPDRIFHAFRDYFKSRTQEEVILLALGGDGGLDGYTVISTGTVNACLVSFRDVFKFLLVANAAAFIHVHNHPHPGCVMASPSDMDCYQKLQEAGRMFNIGMLDGVIIGHEGYFSLLNWERNTRRAGIVADQHGKPYALHSGMGNKSPYKAAS